MKQSSRLVAAHVATFAALLAACGQSSTQGDGGDAAQSDATVKDDKGAGSDATTTDAGGDAPTDAADASDLCNQMCGHIQTCTGITCTQVGVDCTTANLSACVETCVINTSCAQLNNQTAQACQQTCAADGGADGGGDGGTSMVQCSQCVSSSCQPALQACAADTTCSQWLQCIQNCSGNQPASCFAACDATYASAKSLYAPIYTCGCSQCSSQCTALDPCAYGTDGGP
ncbi:MAG TPA: hypothetical protein VLM85_24430 [Polyangiaceae bacterium]|nr:hypothetical protein [Polyangiaceae bacterium]